VEKSDIFESHQKKHGKARVWAAIASSKITSLFLKIFFVPEEKPHKLFISFQLWKMSFLVHTSRKIFITKI
jgi:energy-converting hydrogenase Eha subunit A